MRFTSADGKGRYAALTAVASSIVVATDFDGTLAPIVDDPTKARIHPDAADALAELAPHVAAVAVVTGRPARQVLDLGGLEEVGERIAAAGKELYVFGQYGNERWSSSQRKIRGPVPPPGLASFQRDLPSALRRADAADAYIEDKGLALAIHTRRMDDPAAAFERLLPVVTSMAPKYDLVVEPGRNVIEVRGGGMDKGIVIDRLVDMVKAGGIVFAGDDLGDVDAFESVAAWAKDGLATLLVYSASSEQSSLAPMADVVVDGPGGVIGFFQQLAADASQSAD